MGKKADCASCDSRLKKKKGKMVEGKFYCHRCLSKRPRCFRCNEILIRTSDGDSTIVCQSCHDLVQRYYLITGEEDNSKVFTEANSLSRSTEGK